MVCYVIGSEFHLGKMKKHELAAQNGDVHFGDDSYQTNEEISYNQNGKVLDLILPVIDFNYELYYWYDLYWRIL